MFNVRMKFKKSGSSAYISHLDLMKTLQRSFVRSGLPLKYSQGFNPHIYLSILAPLSTGFESEYELCDFDFDTDVYPENVLEKLNGAFPPGIEAVAVYEQKNQPKNIAYCVYEIVYPEGDAQKMEEYFKTDITIIKESKRQSREVKINDYIKNIVFEKQENGVKCTAVLDLGNDPLNPSYISKALKDGGLLPQQVVPKYKRISLLDRSFKPFE